MKYFYSIIVFLFLLVCLISSDKSFAQSDSWDTTSVGSTCIIYDSTDAVYRMWYAGANEAYKGKIGYAESPDGINWDKDENNPVFEVGSEGSWDHLGVGYPAVVVVNDTCHMWYAGLSDPSSVEIGYATSADGINWTRYENNPVIRVGGTGSWEDTWVYMHSLIYKDSAFHMWYTGATGDVTDFVPWKEEIGYASSTDGINWTKHPSNPVFKVNTAGNWDYSFVDGSSVLFHEDMFHMWYAGARNTVELWQIGHATSADGISWQRNESNPVMTPSGWESPRNQDPNVLFLEDTFHMWYSGGEIFAWKIGYANSENGVNWIKHPEPVLTPGPTGIHNIGNQVVPSEFELFQNYPNPFNPSTTIEFTLPKSEFVELKVFNILGKEVSTMISKKLNQGNHTFTFDGSNLASGVYYYRIKAGNFAETRKMIYLK
jgi:predicted GH43/DUF377 family glycosyl hydrolase